MELKTSNAMNLPKRKLGIVSYQRAEHADNYLNYITKRYERRKHGHK